MLAPSIGLVVDRDPARAGVLAEALRSLGLQPIKVERGSEALERFHAVGPRIVVLDAGLADVSVPELVKHLASAGESSVVLVACAPATRTVVELVQAGAADVLDNVADADELRATLRAALPYPLVRPHRDADGDGDREDRLAFFSRFEHLFRRSARMREVEELVLAVANAGSPALITGEPGSGKTVIASAIHFLSPRGGSPFVKVGCGGLPPEVLELHVFGSRGAEGLLAQAAGGSLFVEEIDEAPAPVQARLSRLARDPDRSVDIRLLAATTADLPSQVARGRFRGDLYEILSAAAIHVPPLRERAEEIVPLATAFLERFSRQFRRPLPRIETPVADALLAYPWPGNVRELENICKRWIVLGSERLVLDELQARRAAARREARSRMPGLGLRDIARRAAREAERAVLEETLARVNGNRAAAARELKVSYKTLLAKLAEAALGDPAHPVRQARP